MPKQPGQSAAQKRIARTEAYAASIGRMFDETVSDILKLKLAKPTEEGVMYSFDGDTMQVRKKVEALLKRLHGAATLAIAKGVEKEWNIANQECDDLVRNIFGKKLFESDRFRAWTAHNEGAMNAFINRSDKGMNLSDRVWKSARQLRDEMEVALTVGMAEGDSAAGLSRQVRQCLNDPDLMFRRFRYKKGEDENGNPIWGRKWKKKVIEDGKTKWIDYDKDSYIPKGTGDHSRGVYKSAAKNAMRVARTETNMAYRRSDYERWQQMSFILGIRIEMSNQHPKPDICDEMQGDYPKNFYFSGWHPMCYAEDTQVLTDEGWKLFSDVRGDELILSLNPDTRETEWVSIIDRQKYEKKGDMIRFSCEDLDILVTPEHSMVYKDKSGKIKRCNASDFDWGKGDIMNMNMSYGFFEKEIVPYDGYVYDLSLDRNHIMYVARNGKCFWGSNCFCYATPILVSEDEMAKVNSEFLQGRTYQPQGQPVLDTPPNFKQWVSDNSDRIRNANSLPYWIKDNPMFVDAKKGAALTPDPAKVEKLFPKNKPTEKDRIEEIAAKRHAARPADYREKLLERRAVTQEADRLLKKAEDFAWNQGIADKGDTLRHVRFAKDTDVEKIKKNIDGLKKRIDKQKQIITNTSKNLDKLATKYEYNQDIKDKVEAMQNASTYTEMRQKQRELAKAISVEVKDNRILSEIIPDVEKWKKQFTNSELHQVKDSVNNTLDKWVKKYNYDSWDKAPLLHKKAKLEYEIQQLVLNKKYKTWEVAQRSYEKSLAKVELDIKIDSIQKDIAAFRSNAAYKFVSYKGEVDKISQYLKAGDINGAERQMLHVKNGSQIFDDYQKLKQYQTKSGLFMKAMAEAELLLGQGKYAEAKVKLQEAEKIKKINESSKNSKAKNKNKSSNKSNNGPLNIGNKNTQDQHLSISMSDSEKIDTTKKLCGVNDTVAKELNDAVVGFSWQWDYEIRQVQCGKTVTSRHGHTQDQIEKKAEDIEKFIELSPKWNGGETYRGMSLSTKELDKLVDDLKQGEGNMLGSASWSTKSSVSEGFSSAHIGETSPDYGDIKNKKVVLVSKTQTKATSIRHLSKFSQEYEVLASKDCRYKYLRQYDQNGITYIEVEPSNLRGNSS